MMRTAALVVVILSFAAAAPADGDEPLLLAYYYTWYTTGFGEQGEWEMWMRKAPATLFPEGTDAGVFRFPPAIRNIASTAYPLIGPYDSDNREVVRWHIRLAKAAGIDGFLVDVWGNLLPKCRRALLDAVLPVAEEEGFKIAIFDEAPQFHGDVEENARWAVDYLRRCKDSPAYLHIDGAPVYGVYQVWEGKMTPAEGRRYMQAVEEEVGDVYWIVDRIVARPGGERPDGIDGIDGFRVRPGWKDIPEIDAFSLYATFSNVREYRPEIIGEWYREIAAGADALGKDIMLPVHPGLDSRAIQLDEVAAAKGEPHWTIPRDDGETLRNYLEAAAASGAEIVSITSFNEWPETTNIEPALTWPDPYRYLKIIAEFTGTDWQQPELPPLEALDPAIRDLLKAQRGN